MKNIGVCLNAELLEIQGNFVGQSDALLFPRSQWDTVPSLVSAPEHSAVDTQTKADSIAACVGFTGLIPEVVVLGE